MKKEKQLLQNCYAENSALAPHYSLSSESYCLCFGGKKLCVTAN